MNRDELIDFVVAEVDEYMGAGRVGVYEFLEILRNPAPDLPPDQARDIGQAALDRLLAAKIARLTWQMWGKPAFERPADGVVPRDADWEIPTDDPYLAVVPVR